MFSNSYDWIQLVTQKTEIIMRKMLISVFSNQNMKVWWVNS